MSPGLKLILFGGRTLAQRIRDIFQSSNGAWYEPSSAILAPWYQDSSATTPVVAVENPVGYATDRSGNGNHATQATSPARPILKSAASIYSPLFDGIDDHWTSATGGGGSAGFTLITAVKPTSGAGTSRTIFSDGGYRVRLNIANQLEFSAAKTPTYGADTIVNGGFETDTNWTKGGGWAIGSGVATAASPTGTTLSQAQTLVAGRTYEVVYSVSAATAGSLRLRFTGGTTVNGGLRTAVGTYTEVLEAAAGNTTIAFVGSGFQGSIDNVSIREITAFTTVATSATLSIGTPYLASAWDDGANLNVQLDSGAVASTPRPTVLAGTAGYTIAKENGAAVYYFIGNIYAWLYARDTGLTAAQRNDSQTYIRQQAGL